MGRLFGTDGVRGVANRDLTAELALALGAAAARRLAATGRATRRVAVVGRDPRASGEMLEAAVIAGLTSEGVDALRVGVLPTPAVAYLTGAYDADFGVMISASHNPMPDNGIKIFGPGGHKLDDAAEDRIEELVAPGPGLSSGRCRHRPRRRRRRRARALPAARRARPPPLRLDGLTVVVDCAHGAASAAAPRAYRAAGADVIAINAEPNGLNINDGCGSTHLDVLQAGRARPRRRSGPGPRRRRRPLPGRRRRRSGHRRRRHHGGAGAGHARRRRAGVQHPGGHRDEQPRACTWRCARPASTVRTTGVGDRYVLEELRAGEYSLGGEQSGHIVHARASAPPATASSPGCG